MAGACKAMAPGPARPLAHHSMGLFLRVNVHALGARVLEPPALPHIRLAILKAAIKRGWRPPRSISKRVKTSSGCGSDRYPRNADVARRAASAFQFAEKVRVASNLNEFTNPIG